MAARVHLYETKLPAGGIATLRTMASAQDIQMFVAPGIISQFKNWFAAVARAAAQDFPKKSGDTVKVLAKSAKVSGTTLGTLRGYFLVDEQVISNEFGAEMEPHHAEVLAIPFGEALYPNGVPKRRGPNAWRPLKTFIYRSKRTGGKYIAYKRAGKVVVLYVLVDTYNLRPLKIVKRNFDKMLPLLYEAFRISLESSLREVFTKDYAIAINQTILGVDKGRIKVPPVPNPPRAARALTPRKAQP